MELPYTYFEDPQFRMPKKFLSDQAYAQAMEALVIVCTDVIFVRPEHRTIFLAKRKVAPAKNWWIIGGRVMAGETALESVVRCTQRETGLTLEPARFTFLTTARYYFRERKQEPVNHGSDNFAFTFTIEPTDAEIVQAASHLDPEEYEVKYGLKEFGLEDLQKENIPAPIMHFYKLLYPQK